MNFLSLHILKGREFYSKRLTTIGSGLFPSIGNSQIALRKNFHSLRLAPLVAPPSVDLGIRLQ
jgi:hypothetical protein